MTGRDYVKAALAELGVYGPSDDPSSEDAQFALDKLNRLIGAWNAKGNAVYGGGYDDFVLTPGLSPHTIGLGGTFNVPSRPIEIQAAALVINAGTSSETQTPITVRDDEWYATQPAPRVSSAIPTDVYYSDDWPLGQLFFWGIPTSNYTVRLWLRALLAKVTFDTVMDQPDGYDDALILSLAESLLTTFPRKTIAEALIANASRARAVIFSNNEKPIRLESDAPVSGGARGSFDYRRGF